MSNAGQGVGEALDAQVVTDENAAAVDGPTPEEAVREHLQAAVDAAQRKVDHLRAHLAGAEAFLEAAKAELEGAN